MVLRKGGKIGYDSSWVEKLKNSVARNLTVPHKFVCLSDCEVPCDRIQLTETDPGFWSKMELFKPGIFSSPVLYIDLDTVICKNIDEIIARCQKEKFVMWYESDKKIHSSALMYWNGDYSYLWDLYKSKPFFHWAGLYSKGSLYGDQAVVSENVAHTLFTDLCPTNWFHITSKNDSYLQNFNDVKLLMFRKAHTKPSTMLDHPLVKQHWR